MTWWRSWHWSTFWCSPKEQIWYFTKYYVVVVVIMILLPYHHQKCFYHYYHYYCYSSLQPKPQTSSLPDPFTVNLNSVRNDSTGSRPFSEPTVDHVPFSSAVTFNLRSLDEIERNRKSLLTSFSTQPTPPTAILWDMAFLQLAHRQLDITT